MDKLLSLCIPTNGITEWVLPVLDSIYSQQVDEDLFEVVVTDNGENEEFKKRIEIYKKNHTNLIYKKTSSYSFLNEIDSYKNANGAFIKFINHRTKMLPGSINYLLDFIKNNINEKPFVYFSNGVLKFKKKKKVHYLNSFNDFIKELNYWSSWSTGMAFWNDDFSSIKNNDLSKFNELFPHTNILFSQRSKEKYIIDDNVLLEEIIVDQKNKGKYDLFYAFAVEFILIIMELYVSNDITYKTFTHVKKKNKKFLKELYFEYIVLKRPSSYRCDTYKKNIKIFYKRNLFILEVPFMIFIRAFKHIGKCIHKKKK